MGIYIGADRCLQTGYTCHGSLPIYMECSEGYVFESGITNDPVCTPREPSKSCIEVSMKAKQKYSNDGKARHITSNMNSINTGTQFSNRMKRFVVECMTKIGTNSEYASQFADQLIYADQRGHYSHGLNRLRIYVNDIVSGTTAKAGTPKILKQKGSTAWVDGNNQLGAVVGNFCMKLAIELAKEHGIGWVVAKGSNHFGAAGFYSTQAAREGLVGMSFSSASPSTYSPRSSEVAIGNNPLSFVAEGENGDNFALDMANSAVARGKVEVALKIGKKEVPSGWGVDGHGVPTNDPEKILIGGGLLPLGCKEETGGYKGFGLCMMVDVMCGVMGGGNFGTNIRQWKRWTSSGEMGGTAVANLGQCFIAVDPECFADGFHPRLQQFLDETRGHKPKDPALPVLVAGDPERAHIEKSMSHGGLIYYGAQVEDLNGLAKKLGVQPCHFNKMAQLK